MAKTNRDKNRKRRKNVVNEAPNKWKRAWYSITMNWPFWTCCIVCVLLLVRFGKSGDSILSAFVTFIATMCIGYDVHRRTHERSVSNMYETSKNPIVSYIRDDLPILKSAISWFIYHCDFHCLIHHDSSVNKTLYNRLIEVYQNLLSEGLIVAYLVYKLDPSVSIGGITLRPHIPTIIFWALIYTSVHNINYDLLHPKEHVNHHLYPSTNYGIDLLDILCETKHETDSIEIMHHGLPNLVISAMAIIQFQQLFSQ